jgi:uncharacterized protein (DUF2164 family)
MKCLKMCYIYYFGFERCGLQDTRPVLNVRLASHEDEISTIEKLLTK